MEILKFPEVLRELSMCKQCVSSFFPLMHKSLGKRLVSVDLTHASYNTLAGCQVHAISIHISA